MEMRRHPFDPSNLPWGVSQRPFVPYRAGAKVYWAYQAGGRAARPIDNLGRVAKEGLCIRVFLFKFEVKLTSYIEYYNEAKYFNIHPYSWLFVGRAARYAR
jgi:hypothetical protein